MRQISRADYNDLFRCLDCGVNTHRIDEYYMVKNSIWLQVAKTGMLCIGCLETRLGRRLTSEDFIDAPINKRGVWFGKEHYFSDRLANRLGFDTESK